MKYKIFNENDLKDDEIDETVVRVKAFILNNNNEILMASSNGGVQLVGGHVEDGEDVKEALKREIKEEAGIEVLSNEISEPFYEIRHYMKNYFDTNKNVIAKMVYYVVKTNKMPNLTLINRTKQEENYAFDIKFVTLDSFEKVVKECTKNEKEINRVIASEMLSAFNVLKSDIL